MTKLKLHSTVVLIILGSIFSSSALFGKDLADARQKVRTGQGRAALVTLREIIADCTAASSTLSEASRQNYFFALKGVYDLACRYGETDLFHLFETSVARDFPENPQLIALVGNCHHYRGEYSLAKEAWERALALDPENLEARFHLLELREWSEPPDALREEYRWFVDYYNEHEETLPADLEWIGRACVKIEKYQWDGAQKAYQQALDASPEFEPVIIAKGDLWLDRYDPENAISYYSSIFKFNT
ncbi:MAG: tetratricopeptide repeat protein, partial [Candidatus Omnitrophica bacterium]|nr:tetratricopeptide repeat protein [Candidatus Omnitrophota bacterium]